MNNEDIMLSEISHKKINIIISGTYEVNFIETESRMMAGRGVYVV